MLRHFLIACGLLMLVGAGGLLFVVQAPAPVAIYVAVCGLLLAGGILFERRGYHPRVHRTLGEWRSTGERFVDPTTGHLMEVRYNPATGERDYVDSSSSKQQPKR